MQDIRDCCDGISKKRLSVIRLRNDIKELNEWKNDETKEWTDMEKKCIQSTIDEKTSIIDYLVKKIKDDKTCCHIVSKAFFDRGNQ